MLLVNLLKPWVVGNAVDWLAGSGAGIGIVFGGFILCLIPGGVIFCVLCLGWLFGPGWVVFQVMGARWARRVRLLVRWARRRWAVSVGSSVNQVFMALGSLARTVIGRVGVVLLDLFYSYFFYFYIFTFVGVWYFCYGQDTAAYSLGSDGLDLVLKKIEASSDGSGNPGTAASSNFYSQPGPVEGGAQQPSQQPSQQPPQQPPERKGVKKVRRLYWGGTLFGPIERLGQHALHREIFPDGVVGVVLSAALFIGEVCVVYIAYELISNCFFRK